MDRVCTGSGLLKDASGIPFGYAVLVRVFPKCFAQMDSIHLPQRRGLLEPQPHDSTSPIPCAPSPPPVQAWARHFRQPPFRGRTPSLLTPPIENREEPLWLFAVFGGWEGSGVRQRRRVSRHRSSHSRSKTLRCLQTSSRVWSEQAKSTPCSALRLAVSVRPTPARKTISSLGPWSGVS